MMIFHHPHSSLVRNVYFSSVPLNHPSGQTVQQTVIIYFTFVFMVLDLLPICTWIDTSLATWKYSSILLILSDL